MNYSTLKEDLPLSLQAKDVSKLLKISLRNAYILCNSKTFPSVRVGNRIVVPRPAFIKWLENPKMNWSDTYK